MVKLYLVIALVGLVGCSKKEGDAASNYPACAKYDKKAAFAADHCDPSLPQHLCDSLFIEWRSNRILDYYGKNSGAINVCDENPYICQNCHVLEDHIRDWGEQIPD